jgi:RNA polymerase subunit RPABC4/transcription elongation factor Spt4
MEVIEEQFHTNMVNGVVAAANTVNALNGALFTGVGHILGSKNYNTITANDVSSSKVHREAMARAAERRRQLSQITRIGGAVLGGRKATSKLSPREAAASAAERRLKDSQWCVLCTDMVELTDDKSDSAIHYEKIAVLPAQQQSSTTSSHPEIVKPTPTECYYGEEQPKHKTSRSTELKRHKGTSYLGSFIDLVESDDESNIAKQSKQETPKRDNDDTARLCNAKRAASIIEIADFTGQNINNMRSIDSNSPIDLTGNTLFSHSANNSEEVFSQLWACKKCTYFNAKKNLSCEVCGSPIVSEGTGQKLARIIQREEEMKQLTIIEQNRSKEQFGGFNIYQGGRKNTITMKHLT